MEKARYYLPILVYFMLLVVFVCAMDFNGLYGQDAHEYYRYAGRLLDWFKTGSDPGDYFWPVWYPLLSAALAYITHIPVLPCLQMVSVTALVAIVWVIVKWNEEGEYRFVNFIYALLFIGLSPLLVRAGLVAMADTLSIACSMLALYCFKLFVERGAQRYVYGFGLLAALAVMSRYAAVVVLLPACSYVGYKLLKSKQFLAIALAIFIGLVICIPHILLRPQAPLAFVQHEWLTSWSVSNFFARDFITPDGKQHYKLPNILFVTVGYINAGFGVLIIFTSLFIRPRHFSGVINKVLLISVIFYALFLAGIPFQNKRFLLATLPLIAILWFPAFLSCLTHLKYPWFILAFFAVSNLVVCWTRFSEFYERNKLEKHLSTIVAHQPENILYTLDVDIAMKSYHTTKEIRNMWVQRYDTFTIGGLALFNEKAFATQWQDKNPMLNWKQLNAKYDLTPLNNAGNGWELFRIEARKED